MGFAFYLYRSSNELLAISYSCYFSFHWLGYELGCNKMLFYPREPKKILGITFQGIFPKRQKQFAEKLGKLVSAEFLSFTDIEQKISDPDNLKKIMPMIESHVDDFL
jgi:hypothetical protein